MVYNESKMSAYYFFCKNVVREIMDKGTRSSLVYKKVCKKIIESFAYYQHLETSGYH
jgi:hypothetical protein